jgi:hypothetical protein
MRKPDPFRPYLGSGRGSNRPDIAVVVEAVPTGREAIFTALKARVRYDTVALELASDLRYVALARSKFDDSLHIVGGAPDLDRISALFSVAEDDDFLPESIVDLEGPSVDNCVGLVVAVITDDGFGSEIQDPCSSGINDLELT